MAMASSWRFDARYDLCQQQIRRLGLWIEFDCFQKICLRRVISRCARISFRATPGLRQLRISVDTLLYPIDGSRMPRICDVEIDGISTALYPREIAGRFLDARDAALLRPKSIAGSRASKNADRDISAEKWLVDLDIADSRHAAAIERVQKRIDRDPKLPQPWALRGKIFLAQAGYDAGGGRSFESNRTRSKARAPYLLLTQVYLASNRQMRPLPCSWPMLRRTRPFRR